MNFGYFCNTTNWNKKLYTQILKEAREIAKSLNLNPNSWEDVSYTLRYMSENAPSKLTKTRIKEALDYVEKVRLYYQTLSVKERKNSKPF